MRACNANAFSEPTNRKPHKTWHALGPTSPRTSVRHDSMPIICIFTPSVSWFWSAPLPTPEGSNAPAASPQSRSIPSALRRLPTLVQFGKTLRSRYVY